MNQAFRKGKTDGLFNTKQPMLGSMPERTRQQYLQGYESGQELRARLKAAGARVTVQPRLI